jgi:HK97 family phage major capsid protein
LEIAIVNGTGSGQPTGILNDARVVSGQKISLTATDIASWGAWQSKVFAKMKKSYRDGVFIMAQPTFDAYINGLQDKNGQPIGRVNYGIDGAEVYRFGGKEVVTVEETVLPAFDTAATGNTVAIFIKLTDYAINSNLQITTEKWTDPDTNEVKNKAIMVCDGKLLDANGVLIINKLVENQA